MSSSAIINIIGNLGRDPETRQAGDSKVCSFSVAVTTRVRGDDVTSWYNVSAWGRLGERCAEYLERGRQVHVSGRLTLRPYESNGEKRISADINASDVTFLGSRSDGGGGQRSESTQGGGWAGGSTSGRAQHSTGGGWGGKQGGGVSDDPIPF